MPKSNPRPGKPGEPPKNGCAKPAGFYGRSYRRQESRDLEAFPANNLQEEIDLLRVALRRVMELGEADTLEGAVKLLNAIGLAAIRKARLLEVLKNLSGETDEMSAAISQALSELMEEMKIGK